MITDRQITAALVGYEGHPTRVEAMRAALEAVELDAVKELERRELHHFETEQIIVKIKAYLESCEQYGDEPDLDDLLEMIGDFE